MARMDKVSVVLRCKVLYDCSSVMQKILFKLNLFSEEWMCTNLIRCVCGLITDDIIKKNGSGKLYGKEERTPVNPFTKPKEQTRVQWERGISF